jgi:hypothetical protein
MEEKTSAAEAAAGAVEQRCPICLEDVNDKTFIDACFHILLHALVVNALASNEQPFLVLSLISKHIVSASGA